MLNFNKCFHFSLLLTYLYAECNDDILTYIIILHLIFNTPPYKSFSLINVLTIYSLVFNISTL